LEFTARVLADLQRLRQTKVDESELEAVLGAVGCEYEYTVDDETARRWLFSIETWLKDWLASRAKLVDHLRSKG
jgi:hypothetical protein